MSHFRGRVFDVYIATEGWSRLRLGNGGRLQPTTDEAETVDVGGAGPTGSADEASAGQGAGG